MTIGVSPDEQYGDFRKQDRGGQLKVCPLSTMNVLLLVVYYLIVLVDCLMAQRGGFPVKS